MSESTKFSRSRWVSWWSTVNGCRLKIWKICQNLEIRQSNQSSSIFANIQNLLTYDDRMTHLNLCQEIPPFSKFERLRSVEGYLINFFDSFWGGKSGITLERHRRMPLANFKPFHNCHWLTIILCPDLFYTKSDMSEFLNVPLQMLTKFLLTTDGITSRNLHSEGIAVFDLASSFPQLRSLTGKWKNREVTTSSSP